MCKEYKIYVAAIRNILSHKYNFYTLYIQYKYYYYYYTLFKLFVIEFVKEGFVHYLKGEYRLNMIWA